MAPSVASAAAAVRLLVSDFERLCEFVHPCDANAGTFSHRTYELLLRACTEFESVAKSLAEADGLISANSQTKVGDWSGLVDVFQLETVSVSVLDWSPCARQVAALNGWADNPHGLAWYRSYNAVKHNRETCFHEASFANVVAAICGCLELLVPSGGMKLVHEIHAHPTDCTVEWTIPSTRFAFRASRDWHVKNAFVED